VDLGESTVMVCRILRGGSEPTLQLISHEGACETEGKYGLISHVFVSNTSLKEGYMAKGNSSQTREGNVRTEKSYGRSDVERVRRLVCYVHAHCGTAALT